MYAEMNQCRRFPGQETFGCARFLPKQGSPMRPAIFENKGTLKVKDVPDPVVVLDVIIDD